MLSIKAAEIRVDKSTTSKGYDFTIPGADIESVSHSRRISKRKDEGVIVLHNDDGEYSSGDTQITVGDRMDVFVAPQQAPTTWDEELSGWGYGGWGGSRLVWSAYVETPNYVRHSPTTSDLVIEGTDYVFAVLSNRVVFDAYEATKISGTSDAILNTVLSREAPEVDLTSVVDVGETTSIVADGMNLLDFVIQLARRGDAVMWGYRDRLLFDSLSNLTPQFTVDGASDIGLVKHAFTGDTVRNVIRIDGGTDYALDDEQPTQDAYTTVTQSSRATFQVNTRKSQLDRIEIWTNPNATNSEESINVRLQKDDAGAPVAIGDEDSDIDAKQLSHEFLGHDNLTTFIMNDHTLPEPSPWVIVETDGPDGQQIGIRTSDSKPTYKAHYPFPVSVQLRDNTSVENYGKVEDRWKQDNLDTLDAARELGQEAIGHYSDPESEVTFPAISRRVHRLDPGELITFDMARERLSGDYIVTETDEKFDGSTYNTTLKAADIDTI